MKIIVSTLLFLGVVALSKAQMQPEKRLLLSLQTGEVPYFNESNLLMNCGSTGFCLLVNHPDGGFYVYDNAIRKGPFASAAEAMKICYKNEQTELYIKPVTTWEQADMNDYVIAAGEGYVVQFKGKNYGPYMYVQAMHVSPDGLHFMAVARNATGVMVFGDQLAETKTPGEVKSLQWSPDSKSGFAVFLTGFDATTLENIDLSGMTEQQQMEYMMNIQKQIEEAKEEIFIIFNDGKKLGPFAKGSESNSNPAYSTTAPGHWIMIQERKLYIDGIEVYSIPENEWVSTDDVFLSSDAKQFAIRFYDRIWFSNGSEFAYPILINRCGNSNSRIEWISLEDETKLMYYSLPW